MTQGYNYLAIGGSADGQQIVQQFPVNWIEMDVNGQPQSYRKVPVPVFDRVFEVLVYEPLTKNRADLSTALARSLLSGPASALWEVGSPLTPPATQGDGQSSVPPTRQQPAVGDEASR
jgi:hypothetical protein